LHNNKHKINAAKLLKRASFHSFTISQVTAGLGEGWWMSGSSVVVHVNVRPVTSDMVIATAPSTGVSGRNKTASGGCNGTEPTEKEHPWATEVTFVK
jgi:hypothetical protein